MTCGIYCFENLQNGKKYVGKSVNIEKRHRAHEYCLDANKHTNQYLADSWMKYGKENFSFYIIEECDESLLSKKEIFYILNMQTRAPNGFNFTDGGEGKSGAICSQETRQQLSESHLDKYPSEESRKKMSVSQKQRFLDHPEKHPLFGKHHSEETCQKMSETKMGKHHGEETRQKMSDSRKQYLIDHPESNKGEKNPNFGNHHSAEVRQKMSLSHKQYCLDHPRKEKIN